MPSVALQRILDRTEIPERFLDRKLDDCPDRKARDQAGDYLDNLDENLALGVGRTFLGPPGTGKTTMACVIGLTAFNRGVSVLYITVAEYYRRLLLGMDLKEAWSKHDDVDAYASWKMNREKLLRIRNVYKMLILDDVGKEHTTASQYSEGELDFLLRHRYDKGLPTIITSNVPLLKWSARYSAAMESFICEAAPPIMIEVDDLRRKK